MHPVSGKVTLKGKAYKRLLVYFRPMEGKINKFNMGVGETDEKGNMKVRSTAGLGLAEGKYRVSFSCVKEKSKRSNKKLKPGEKNDDDPTIQVVELVGQPYDEENNSNTSPKEYEVNSGSNTFDFDIPKKNKL